MPLLLKQLFKLGIVENYLNKGWESTGGLC